MGSGLKTVMVVDDSKTFVMYLGLLLRRMGYGIIPARSGLEALKLFNTAIPDVILLDLEMPEMHGIELLRHIRSDAALARVPVVIVSVDIREQSRALCQELGCSAFLDKPVVLRALHEVLQRCLAFPGQRQGLRASFGRKIILDVAGARSECHAVILSEGGIYLRSGEPLAKGTAVHVELNLEGAGSMRLAGTVIYTREVFADSSGMEPGMAIEFTMIPPQEAAALRGYVTGLLAGDIIGEPDEAVIGFLEGSQL